MDDFFEGLQDAGFGFAAYVFFRRFIGRPIGHRPRRYTPRPAMVSRYACACPREHPHEI